VPCGSVKGSCSMRSPETVSAYRRIPKRRRLMFVTFSSVPDWFLRTIF